MEFARSFRGCCTIITGAGRGIGRALAVRLARSGASVMCVARTRSELDETVATAGENAFAKQGDISAPGVAHELIDTALAKFGRLDLLVHSAGVMHTGPIDDYNQAEFDRIFAINVRSPYALMHAALTPLKSTQGQLIIINSSIIRAANLANRGVFAATQMALKALTDSVRDEANAAGVRVISVMPGTTASPRQASLFNQSGRLYKPELLLQPEDVAEAACNALLMPRTAEITDIFVRPMLKS